MSSEKDNIKKEKALARELIQSLDKLLEAGDWESTLFLKANKKRLLDLRSQAESALASMTSEEESKIPKKKEIPPGFKIVYISLFQTEPNNLQKWQNAIKALEKYSVSRPVYANEEHVRTLIRNKLEPTKEGYVVALVNEKDIVKPYLGKKTQDRYGNELITLRESAIHLDQIIEFVHNNMRYQYSNKGLILFSTNSPVQ